LILMAIMMVSIDTAMMVNIYGEGNLVGYYVPQTDRPFCGRVVLGMPYASLPTYYFQKNVLNGTCFKCVVVQYGRKTFQYKIYDKYVEDERKNDANLVQLSWDGYKQLQKDPKVLQVVAPWRIINCPFIE